MNVAATLPSTRLANVIVFATGVETFKDIGKVMGNVIDCRTETKLLF